MITINYLIILTALIIYQISFFFIVNDFKLKNYFYLISPIITFIIPFLLNNNHLINLPLYLIIQTLINLSMIDLKYLEISGKSYIFLLLPAISSIFLFRNGLSAIISFIIILVIFIIFDKIFGIEGFGGADVKILLILSFCFKLEDVFTFIYLCLLLTIVVYFILAIKNRRFKKIKVPMIVSITIIFIYMSLWIYLQVFI